MVSRHQLVRVLLLCGVTGLFIGGIQLPAGQAVPTEFACCVTSPEGDTTVQCHPFTNLTECIDVLGGSPADSLTCSALCGSSTNRPPDCSMAHAHQPRLDPPQYPPNHEFVPIDIEGVTDPDGDPVMVTVVDIFQDEKLVNDGSGRSCPDGDLLGGRVRAERQGRGNGRVYHIMFAAEDDFGGTCQGTVKVCVPHDRASACVDEGPLYDSTDPDRCWPNFPLQDCLADCGREFAACSQVAHVDFNECIAVELQRVCAAELAANLDLCREDLRDCRIACFGRFGEG